MKSAGDYAQSKRPELAARIMENYLGKSAVKEINLPAAMAETINTKYAVAKKSKKYPADLFKAADAEIHRLMLVNLRNPQRIKEWDLLLAKIK